MGMETQQGASPVERNAQGIVQPGDLPALFLQFGLEYIEGMAFPWQHRWAPKDGRALERFQRKQTSKLCLVIHALGSYRDESGPIDGHLWQFTRDGLD